MIKAFDNIGEIFQGIEQWVLNSVNLLKATWLQRGPRSLYPETFTFHPPNVAQRQLEIDLSR
jgi:hypothetical protein